MHKGTFYAYGYIGAKGIERRRRQVGETNEFQVQVLEALKEGENRRARRAHANDRRVQGRGEERGDRQARVQVERSGFEAPLIQPRPTGTRHEQVWNIVALAIRNLTLHKLHASC